MAPLCTNIILHCVGTLSFWMRYYGYHLAGHTLKEEAVVPTVEDCWDACLQEIDSKCLAVAYAFVGSRSCRLYDIKALSVYWDWSPSDEFSYYEYCVNGGLRDFIHNYICIFLSGMQHCTNQAAVSLGDVGGILIVFSLPFDKWYRLSSWATSCENGLRWMPQNTFDGSGNNLFPDDTIPFT